MYVIAGSAHVYARNILFMPVSRGTGRHIHSLFYSMEVSTSLAMFQLLYLKIKAFGS